MRATATHTVTSLARAAAVLLTVVLFTLGSIPATGQAFPGAMHWVAHFVAYAMIAFAYGRGWSRQSALLITAFVATMGIIHEATEIITHSHNFETDDVIVNAIGAVIGVIIQRTLQLAASR